MSRSASALVLASVLASLSATQAGAGSYGGGGGGGAPAQNSGPAPEQSAAPAPLPTTGGGDGQSQSAPAAQSLPMQASAADPAAAEGDAPAADAKLARMTAADAAENFKTVVESYVAKKSRGGAWEYKEKGATSPLVLKSVEAGGVRKTGERLYAGDAVLRQAGTKRTRRLEFTVDFTGPSWKVVRVRPSKAPR